MQISFGAWFGSGPSSSISEEISQGMRLLRITTSEYPAGASCIIFETQAGPFRSKES